MGDHLVIPGVVDNGLELLIGEPSSDSSLGHYIHLGTNTLGKGMYKSTSSPPQLISKNYITKTIISTTK